MNFCNCRQSIDTPLKSQQEKSKYVEVMIYYLNPLC